MTTALVWFRRDLRVHDHPPLRAALDACERVVPVFVLDDRLLGGRPPSSRDAFLFACLKDLREALQQRGGDLVVVRGSARARAAEAGARARRDRRLLRLRRLAVRDARATSASRRRCKRGGRRAAAHARQLRRRHRQAEAVRRLHAVLARLEGAAAARGPRRAAQGRRARRTCASARSRACRRRAHRSSELPGGERAGRERMHAWLPTARPTPARTTGSTGGTSCSRPYLHFGCDQRPRARAARRRHDAYTRQLAWRDFYAHVLLHHPGNARHAFRRELDGIEWDGSDEHFDAWREGRTGFPVVDAGMRQLAATGWMHNRARLITACFLVKDLHIDWRRGERHFMRLLLDGDVGPEQRQLAVDLLGRRRSRAAAPPPLQPGAASSSATTRTARTCAAGCRSCGHAAEQLATPWEAGPEPIVDHAVERERTLAGLRRARGS